MKKTILASAVLCGLIMCQPQPAHAFNLGPLGTTILNTAMEITAFREQIRFASNEGKKQTLSKLKQEYGVSQDAQANEKLNQITFNLLNAVGEKEKISPDFTFFVTPSEEINAACGLGNNVLVLKGVFDKLNEDEAAFVLAHEIGHGQGKHLIKSADKMISIKLIKQIYQYNGGNFGNNPLFEEIITKQLINQTTSIPDEWDADNRAFDYATRAGYNPGAGAAEFVKLTTLYGDNNRNVLMEIMKPSDHPTNSARMKNFAEKMTAYSKGNVTVKNDQIFIKGKYFMTPVATDTQTSTERAYLIAGQIAKAYHDIPGKLKSEAMMGMPCFGNYMLTEFRDEDGNVEDIVNKLNTLL